jgi:Ca2+-binding EF-hand superfamily protein
MSQSATTKKAAAASVIIKPED